MTDTIIPYYALLSENEIDSYMRGSTIKINHGCDLRVRIRDCDKAIKLLAVNNEESLASGS